MKTNIERLNLVIAQMTTAKDVYAGPGGASSYSYVGSVDSGETVYAYWTENGYCYIEYKVTSTQKWKCGYVPASTLNKTVPYSIPASNAGTRYVNKNTNTWYGYSTDATLAGSVSYGEAVYYMGVKVDGYAFIQYNVSSTGLKKRAWVPANDLSTSRPAK